MSILEKLIQNLAFKNLSQIWQDQDFESFSENKQLFAYQKEALENALLVLFEYFGNEKSTEDRKKDFFKILESHGLSPADQKFFAHEQKSPSFDILTKNDYYRAVDRKINDFYLPAYHFINRMSFWMATGSGKSVVLIKLMEMLVKLMKNNLIPEKKILFLTHRQDLIEQLSAQISEFNAFAVLNNGFKFIEKEIRTFDDSQQDIFKDSQIPIYFYRSDLLSDKSKENIINFETYQNNGNWYLILDEAHKGDSGESKRKQYYNILSRNGFLFNFSATFTDPMEQLMTVYNINLAAYINKGFGKHLYLFEEGFKSFKADQKADFEQEDKQKIVLMSLIQFAYIKKKAKALRQNLEIYHEPLLMTLVNSVSKKESDLDLFFQELRKIALKKVNADLFVQARQSLMSNLYQKKYVEFEFEKEVLGIAEIEEIEQIGLQDILEYVFNTTHSGDFEVKMNPKNKQELSFRVKSGSAPFALIKIGDTKEFIKNNLQGYSLEQEFKNISYFENINHSSINILMGSRAFYEGWDSTRPNVINFVNIGTQAEAQKFILQSLGRGIRIEPTKNKRQRLDFLTENPLKELTNQVNAIETLFIFGTNKNILQIILNVLQNEKLETEKILSGFEKTDIPEKLLIPVYETLKKEQEIVKTKGKFRIHEQDWELFDDLMNSVEDLNLLLNFNLTYAQVKLLRAKHANSKNFKKIKEQKIGKLSLLVKLMIQYFNISLQKVADFTELTDEINHFQKVKVMTSNTGSHTSISFEKLKKLQESIYLAKKENDFDLSLKRKQLREDLKANLIDDETFESEYEKLTQNQTQAVQTFSHDGREIVIQKIAKHYYFPSILSKKDRVEWLKHIISNESEVKFMNALKQELQKENHLFKSFDWWFFSKIDHHLDKKLHIPYIDTENTERLFLPDFIFWFKKANNYHLVYVDPKGTGRSEYEHKVDGYRVLFESQERPKCFVKNGQNIYVHLKLVTEDSSIFSEKNYYQKYWFDVDHFQDFLKDLDMN